MIMTVTIPPITHLRPQADKAMGDTMHFSQRDSGMLKNKLTQQHTTNVHGNKRPYDGVEAQRPKSVSGCEGRPKDFKIVRSKSTLEELEAWRAGKAGFQF